jgi:protein-disulfide isomerase
MNMMRAALVGVLVIAASGVGGAPANLTGRALGDPRAPLRIELYSDYQCPGCKMLHDETIRPLIDDYVRTGKVYLVQHEFPLVGLHPHAREAACYACAADTVGKYRQVCDRLFQTQERWAKDGNVDAAACSALSATEAGKVRTLAKSKEIADAVDTDVRNGRNEGVSSTPTMIVVKTFRKYPLTGPVRYAVLRRFLDSLL